MIIFMYDHVTDGQASDVKDAAASKAKQAAEDTSRAAQRTAESTKGKVMD